MGYTYRKRDSRKLGMNRGLVLRQFVGIGFHDQVSEQFAAGFSFLLMGDLFIFSLQLQGSDVFANEHIIYLVKARQHSFPLRANNSGRGIALI